MYCVNCGKAVTGEMYGNMCYECASRVATYVQPIKPPYGDPANKKVGFGNALAATIMGVIGFIFSYIAFIVSGVLMGDSAVAWVLLLASIGLSIASLALGIGSIKVFSGFKNARPKPVATLVLGIVGIVSSALAVWIILMNLLLIGILF